MHSFKFGGTSMGSAGNVANVAKILLLEKNQKKSVVVSAMSGVTDQLLQAGELAKSGRIEEAKKLIDEIRLLHFMTVEKLVQKTDILEFSKNFIHSRTEKLKEFLTAIAIIQEISPRSHDEIVALGEKLSAHILTVHLRDLGIDTEFVNLENIVPENEKIVDREFFERIQEKLRDRILPLIRRGAIPVITGFFGKIPEGIVHAVGRGYSDFTASLVGSACNSEEIQIWTDVDGILSADPRIVADAFSLEELSFEEASELANFGAKVIHPQTIWPAVKNTIPVRIKNTMNPTAPGTRITKEGKLVGGPFKSITAKKGIILLTIHSFEMSGHGFMEKIFRIFSQHKVSIDIIATSEASLSVTLNGKIHDLSKLIQDLSEFSTVEVEEKNAIIAVIGEEMKNRKGIAGHIFSALGDADINIKIISQGATELNISAVIPEEDVQKGIAAIHNSFFCEFPKK